MGTPKSLSKGRAMQNEANNNGTTLQAQMARPVERFIYLYNILRGWEFPPVEQPPTFPRFRIPTCSKNEKFAWTVLPEIVNEIYAKPGENQVMYVSRDGREAANSLVNPDAHPGNPFEAQFRDISQFGNKDMTARNLNELGVFWSFTEPDDPALDEEITAMQRRVDATMKGLITKGNRLAMGKSEDRANITPLMHFAMDYFHLQSKWHESNEHRVPCPNCGESVREGIAYHKNEFGDRCIIDRDRYEAAIELSRPKRQEVSQQAQEMAKAPVEAEVQTS
jgi:hypothetical protein